MVGGVSGGYPVLVPVDHGSERRDRAIGQAGPGFDYLPAKRREEASTQDNPTRDLQPQEDSTLFQQRVESRIRAQAARLEKDDSSTLPRQNQQALRTYGEVFSTREDLGVDLVTLDLRV